MGIVLDTTPYVVFMEPLGASEAGAMPEDGFLFRKGKFSIMLSPPPLSTCSLC
tara:strand:+ start:1232 stop:1390 length:159 start_codon:yes stop_codon:yes gene_type:complete